MWKPETPLLADGRLVCLHDRVLAGARVVIFIALLGACQVADHQLICYSLQLLRPSFESSYDGQLWPQVVFTDPPIPRAGELVDVLYNPDLTALRGRPQAWVRAGWNRSAPHVPAVSSMDV